MTVYELYDEMLRDDSNNEKFKDLLTTAEGKIFGSRDNFTAFELCALIDGMFCFENWEICTDYWDLDSWDDIYQLDENEEMDYEDLLLECMRYSTDDICTEYVTRKLCCLIDTRAPREEIEKWYTLYECWTTRYSRDYSYYSLSDTEQKFFCWYENQAMTPVEFAETLPSQDIIELLGFAAYELPNNNLPCDETDYDYPNWSRYQIVSQYIRARLCYCLDQKDRWEDIEKWYKLNFAFIYFESVDSKNNKEGKKDV